MKITTGILPHKIIEEIIESLDTTEAAEPLRICKKDPSMEIKREVWDGLPEPARAELKNKGYYREGDNIYFE